MNEQDAVTRLWTREIMNTDLPLRFAEAAKSRRPLSLIMIDIDHFKKVNDVHGHQKGDAVLAGVAACIAAVAEGKGRVYRYGGEEMLVILINHDVQEATAVAERARRELESAHIGGLPVTASFGVGTYPDHGTDLNLVIKAADQAMYDAKHRGRNLVRVSGEPAPEPAKARRPERKLPTPGALTEEQQQSLREQHFRGYAVKCPEDGAILEVSEIQSVDSATVGLIVRCKLCGLTDHF